ncbi:hypothetical protein B0H19DRAFT_1276619 [Mycena capillaripes]|nr:hypothetical protein B0H19DRAFT_1276619 [Mycena capillaripes]
MPRHWDPRISSKVNLLYSGLAFPSSMLHPHMTALAFTSSKVSTLYDTILPLTQRSTTCPRMTRTPRRMLAAAARRNRTCAPRRSLHQYLQSSDASNHLLDFPTPTTTATMLGTIGGWTTVEKFQLSALLLTLALGLVSAAPAAEGAVAERSVFDDCFNLGFQDGESAGCNAASGNRKRREYDDILSLLFPAINGPLDIVREARQL